MICKIFSSDLSNIYMLEISSTEVVQGWDWALQFVIFCVSWLITKMTVQILFTYTQKGQIKLSMQIIYGNNEISAQLRGFCDQFVVTAQSPCFIFPDDEVKVNFTDDHCLCLPLR